MQAELFDLEAEKVKATNQNQIDLSNITSGSFILKSQQTIKKQNHLKLLRNEKNIFYTFNDCCFFIQGYSQTMNDNFQSLSMDFDAMRSHSLDLYYRFNDLRTYSEWNAAEHFNMGQGNQQE